MTDPMETASAIAAAHDDPSWSKPLCCSFMGLAGSDVGTHLDERGVPEFNVPEDAVAAMAALARRGSWLRRTEPEPATLDGHPTPDLARARSLLAEARRAGQSYLDLARATAVLRSAGIRYNRTEAAADEEAAVRAAEGIGFPVVVKLISPDVVHKSDVGGVVLDVIDEAGVRAACGGIRARVAANQPDACVTGFTISEQVKGTEIIVGMSRDADFGPLIMVGIGGVFVEVYKDVAFRLVPLTRRDALDMIDEIRAQALLDGARNRPVLDRSELAEVLVRVSALVEEAPDVSELDVNPLVITDAGLVAIDARVVIGQAASARA
jgi:acetyltransferase